MSEDAKRLTANEECLIGSILQNPVSIDVIASMVRQEDFITVVYGKMFRELVLLSDAGKPIDDLVFLFNHLRQRKIAGDDLMQLSVKDVARMINNSVASNGVVYAEEVVKQSQLRKQRALIHSAEVRLGDVGADPQEVSKWLMGEIEKIASRSQVKAVPMGELEMQWVDSFRSRKKVEKSRAYPTGLDSLDTFMGGVAAKELVIVAGRPSSGKTALTTQILEHNAIRGRRSIFFSLEMDGSELAERRLGALAGVSSQRLKSLSVSDDEVAAMEDAAKLRKKLPVLIVDRKTDNRRAEIDVRKIRALSKLEKESNGLDLIAIDYLTLIKPVDSREPREVQIGKVAEELKSIAQELEICVLVLSQLNRMAAENKPGIHHLRESGKIDEHADVVLLVHNNPEKRDFSKAVVEAEIIIGKARNGTPGTVVVGWEGSKTRFVELD